MSIDPKDRQILAELQRDSRSSLDNLAHASDLSVPSVQRRLRKMRESGLISGERAVIDPKALGYAMSFIVMVELERERADIIDAFKRRMSREPQVQQCYYITGEADFALICLARDMEDYEALTRRLFFDDANVRRFRTNVVMSRSKVTLNVPLD